MTDNEAKICSLLSRESGRNADKGNKYQSGKSSGSFGYYFYIILLLTSSDSWFLLSVLTIYLPFCTVYSLKYPSRGDRFVYANGCLTVRFFFVAFVLCYANRKEIPYNFRNDRLNL